MIQLLSDKWFWVMALTINIVFSVIKPIVDNMILFINSHMPSKIQIDTDDEKRTFYYIVIIGLSLITFYLMKQYDTVKLIENSLIVSAIWLAIFSIIIYDIGINFILSMFKKIVKSNIEK